MTHQYVFDYHEGDIYWCTADVGWVTGHSYIVYGPLANGATTLMFEGTKAIALVDADHTHAVAHEVPRGRSPAHAQPHDADGPPRQAFHSGIDQEADAPAPMGVVVPSTCSRRRRASSRVSQGLANDMRR